MKFNFSEIFDLIDIDESQDELIYSLDGLNAMKQLKLKHNTDLETLISEIYKDRLKGEGAHDFMEQSTFLAEMYKAIGLYHQAHSIYKKLLEASPKNKKFKKALEEIKLSMN